MLSLMLADLGADVVKVENPSDGGDYARSMPPYTPEGLGAVYALTNRSKRSLALDLKSGAGLSAFLRLSGQADIVLDGFRPGVLERLGCGPLTLRAHNPRLIVCSLSGWGQTGPLRERAGHDLTYAAEAGLLGMMSVPQPFGGQAADVGGAHLALAAILGAILLRQRTGEGAWLDVSLFDAAVTMGLIGYAEAAFSGDDTPRGALTGRFACYRVYGTRDGQYVALAALEPRFWGAFCTTVGRPDWMESYLEADRQPALIDAVGELFASQTAAYWQALLEPADCCFQRVKTPADALVGDQMQARGLIRRDATGALRVHALPTLAADEVETAAPALGADTEAVLLEYGFTQEEVADLKMSGACGR
jgi:crotonobetainyl-CoA:carnitine CoA-transferase CaiB-like acyl-CoA transferase